MSTIAAPHIPVLRDEAVAALAPHAGGRYLDATFGAGGYTRAILETRDTCVLALDRDPSAIRSGYALVDEMGRADAREASRRLAVQDRAEGGMDREPPARISSSSPRLTLVEARFSELADVARAHDFEPLDGVVFDIGVSSMQFDQAERGFSFRFDGPLDMRMEASGTSAADIVNEADEETLADIFYFFGEERAARRIARAIVHDRKLAPFTSTKSLAEMIARVAPNRASDIHPATKSFQALRIAVNDELGQLLDGLAGAEAVLKEGGRLAVVTFHSLEDRIVKQFLAERCGRGETGSRRLPGEAAPPPASFICEGRQPVAPSREETQANPRARSAKLRHATRTGAPALPIGDKLSRLARPPSRDNKTMMGKA